MDGRATAADAPGSGADQREYLGEERRQRHLQIIWAGADVGGLFAAHVDSFANNLGPGPPLFALNLGQKSRCLWVEPRMLVGRYNYRATAKVAMDEAIGSDQGDGIVAAMIGDLRERGILLPAPTVLERIGLAARARARKQAHQNLVAGLASATIAGLEALIAVGDDQDRTPLAWLREWPEAPTQKNLVGIVE